MPAIYLNSLFQGRIGVNGHLMRRELFRLLQNLWGPSVPVPPAPASLKRVQKMQKHSYANSNHQFSLVVYFQPARAPGQSYCISDMCL